MAPDRICFIGDSIAVGYTDADGLGWPGRLTRDLVCGDRPVSCYNLGVNGDTTVDIARRWRAEVEARSRDGGPGLLVFAFGVNDAAIRVGKGPQIDRDRSRANAHAIIAEAKELAPVLWIGPTPSDESINPMIENGVAWEMWNANCAGYSTAYAAVAVALDVPYLDLVAALAGDERYMAALAASDGLHPATDGYARIAELVSSWDAWRALTA